MSDSGDAKPDPAGQPSGPQPQGESGAPAPQTDDVFEFAESEPAAAGADETTPVWYAATAGGQRDGPLSPAVMKRRITAGQLTGETLVWKEGMVNWVPAQTVPELCAPTAAAPQAAASQPGVPPTPPAAKKTAALGNYLHMADSIFSGPRLFRLAGRVCAALAVVTLLLSLVLWYKGYTWFTGALLFALAFFVGEAAGAILQALGRLQAQWQSLPDSTSNERT